MPTCTYCDRLFLMIMIVIRCSLSSFLLYQTLSLCTKTHLVLKALCGFLRPLHHHKKGSIRKWLLKPHCKRIK